jgi:ubiquinone/menaquinone biosynthesis C-methylase UbiE
MTTTIHSDLAPNHHADHPGFQGVSGLVAAIGFNVGRDGDADLAIRVAGVTAADDVVDIGCGPGVAARRAAAAGAASVVGVDPAAVMLRVARLTPGPRGRAKVRYLEAAAESLPLPDGSASVVWSLATVHHWGDIERGLAEVRRVLRPGGRFLAIERRVERGATGHASHGWIDEQADLFADRCEDTGFTSVTVERHDTARRTVLTVLAVKPT